MHKLPLDGYTADRCIARANGLIPPGSHLNHPTTHPGLIMLTIKGPSSRYCDGRNRRSFLKIGGLSF
ncbi:hypothetical protein, partial [Stieleria sp.]|uniref:hypothetical protein n=1 Tax=Stieleria sp. TaxID=2795976 RepID=UPI003566D810